MSTIAGQQAGAIGGLSGDVVNQIAGGMGKDGLRVGIAMSVVYFVALLIMLGIHYKREKNFRLNRTIFGKVIIGYAVIVVVLEIIAYSIYMAKKNRYPVLARKILGHLSLVPVYIGLIGVLILFGIGIFMSK